MMSLPAPPVKALFPASPVRMLLPLLPMIPRLAVGSVPAPRARVSDREKGVLAEGTTYSVRDTLKSAVPALRTSSVTPLAVRLL